MRVVGSGSRRLSSGSSSIRTPAMPPPIESHYLLTGVIRVTPARREPPGVWTRRCDLRGRIEGTIALRRGTDCWAAGQPRDRPARDRAGSHPLDRPARLPDPRDGRHGAGEVALHPADLDPYRRPGL